MKFTAAFVGLVAMVTLATAAPVAEPQVKPACGLGTAARPCEINDLDSVQKPALIPLIMILSRCLEA